jgi:hypothetical protein
MRSNLAIAEEMQRIAGYLRPLQAGEVSCPNSQCSCLACPCHWRTPATSVTDRPPLDTAQCHRDGRYDDWLRVRHASEL